MTTIRELKRDKRDAVREEKEIKERLSQITKRRMALEKQIQDQCKHTKYYITECGHWDTLGKYAGSRRYKYCEGCGVKLDSKYFGGYNNKLQVQQRLGW